MRTMFIVGISGTFMSALAILAQESGYLVRGCDAACYPPVSDLLKDKEIPWYEGYESCEEALNADVVVVGNVAKRGMPIVEALMDAGKPLISGPQWLAENILHRYRVIALSGTHGKTTTTAMTTHILEQCGAAPGFLIGGVDPSLGTNARLGQGDYFVIEADEYDSTFYDKRPKFMHYKPYIAVINNLEYDHADIYPDLAAIQKQFHYLLRTIPSNGIVLANGDDNHLSEVLEKGVYSRIEHFTTTNAADWQAKLLKADGSAFTVLYKGEPIGDVYWALLGDFNVQNALAAIAVAYHAGLNFDAILAAIAEFSPVKRRLEWKGCYAGVTVYDDFAHHPTAIRKTLHAVRTSGRFQRVIAVVEMASYTMRKGVHQDALIDAFEDADYVIALQLQQFSLQHALKARHKPWRSVANNAEIIEALRSMVLDGDVVVVMSNRGFNGLVPALTSQLQAQI